MIKEFPITTKTLLVKKIIFSGGGYFRLVPYAMLKRWSAEAANGYPRHMTPRVWHDLEGNVVMHKGEVMTRDVGYLMAYLHPRDLDARQPVLKGLPLGRKFKSYVGVEGAAEKLRNYLKDFSFTDIRTAANQIAWDKVPIVEL